MEKRRNDGVSDCQKLRRTQKHIFNKKMSAKTPVNIKKRFLETRTFAVSVNRPLTYTHTSTGAVSLFLRLLDSLPACQKILSTR